MFLINGERAEQIAVTDRGLHYGDGLFETIAIHHNTPILWNEHITRLQQGCQKLAIPIPDSIQLREEAEILCQGVEAAVLKIIITRGSGGRGYYTPGSLKPTRILGLYSWPSYPNSYSQEGVNVICCRTGLGHNSQLAGIKHLNRLEQILARQEWNSEDIAEGIMLDHNGDLIEGTMSNLFIVRNKSLYTPSLHNCGVAGIIRQIILDGAEQLKIPYEIGRITLDDLFLADEVFLTNSLIGLWPVKKIDRCPQLLTAKSFYQSSNSAFEYTRLLQQHLQQISPILL